MAAPFESYLPLPTAAKPKAVPLRVGFDPGLRIEHDGCTISSDGGLLVFRDLYDATGLGGTAEGLLRDNRTGRNVLHGTAALFRQSLFSRVAHYTDLNDAERLALDPVMRYVVGGPAKKGRAASTSQMWRFETEALASDGNFRALRKTLGAWVARALDARLVAGPLTGVVLDLDGTFIKVHGNQEGAAYNTHAGCVCYHPLLLLNGFGDIEGCLLRGGGVHDSIGWEEVLKPAIARYLERGAPIRVRADAAFGKPALYDYLEGVGASHAIRIKSNARLRKAFEGLFEIPRDMAEGEVRYTCAEARYGARSWGCERRVVAKAEWHAGELFPRNVYYVVTNMDAQEMSAEEVFAFYNGRGKAEQFIGEAKHAAGMTRLSCGSFRGNEVRLLLHALAYNLGNFVRTIALPGEIGQWSLTTILEKLVKTGARMVRHAGAVTFRLAEVAIDRHLFGRILERIEDMRRWLAGPPREQRRRHATA